MRFRREQVEFDSAGTQCVGVHYDPIDARDPDPPVVVMAHGLGGERTWRLPAYAERFAKAGIAAFLFDYRHFGRSAGRPRNLLSPGRQLADWEAALERVRDLPFVDGSRIALWGTSLSGGHVLRVAAEDGDVRAVVAQVPVVDGRKAVGRLAKAGGIGYAATAARASLSDVARKYTFRSPHTVPLTATDDSFSLLGPAIEDARPLTSEEEAWAGEYPARALLALARYRPASAAAAVDCPAFVAQATEDTIAATDDVDGVVTALDDVERVRLPVGHFDVRARDAFERLVERERSFLERRLGP